MSTTREQAYQALFALLSGSYPWASTPSRKVKLWGDVDQSDRPALFQGENFPDKYLYKSGTVLSSQQRIIHARIYAYVNSTDVIGAQQLNAILDAFDAALEPMGGADGQTGLNTLGDLVYSCRIANVLLKDPGDIDNNDGMLVVDIEIVMP